ncbi:MAG: VanZ family protein [Eubacterium sp.]|nr:VanZ family protein [Eubacterium sp.]
MSLKEYIISSLIYMLIAIPFVIIFRFKHYKNKETLDIKREAAIMLFFMFVFMIFCQTAIPASFKYGDFRLIVFHKADFSNYKYFPRLMTGWLMWKLEMKDYEAITINILGNVLIFIPVGFLAPIIWKNLKMKSVLIGFLLSCFVEFIQLFTERQSDYNDIIMNTAGAFAGYLLFLLIKLIHKKTRKH